MLANGSRGAAPDRHDAGLAHYTHYAHYAHYGASAPGFPRDRGVPCPVLSLVSQRRRADLRPTRSALGCLTGRCRELVGRQLHGASPGMELKKRSSRQPQCLRNRSPPDAMARAARLRSSSTPPPAKTSRAASGRSAATNTLTSTSLAPRGLAWKPSANTPQRRGGHPHRSAVSIFRPRVPPVSGSALFAPLAVQPRPDFPVVGGRRLLTKAKFSSIGAGVEDLACGQTHAMDHLAAVFLRQRGGVSAALAVCRAGHAPNTLFHRQFVHRESIAPLRQGAGAFSGGENLAQLERRRLLKNLPRQVYNFPRYPVGRPLERSNDRVAWRRPTPDNSWAAAEDDQDQCPPAPRISTSTF